MIRRGLVLLLVGLAWAPCATQGQQKSATVSIGFLSVNSRNAMKARVDAFDRGLRELGYQEGKNVTVEYRFADQKPERLPALANELLRLNVVVIVTEGTTATRYAREATSTTPIVMAQDPDPVGTGFVESLARPGGNVTGLSNLRTDLGVKRLQILRDAVPGLTRVAVVGTSATPGNAQALRDLRQAAEALQLDLQILEVANARDIYPAFQAAEIGQARAVLVLASPHLLSNRTQVADAAQKSRIPTIYYISDYVRDGGLMSYGVSATDLFRRAAIYVDKIVKGARAGELPVEQPSRLEFVVNLKSAKAIGLTIPASLLASADEVIE